MEQLENKQQGGDLNLLLSIINLNIKNEFKKVTKIVRKNKNMKDLIIFSLQSYILDEKIEIKRLKTSIP